MVLHSALNMKTDVSSCVKNEKRARERSSNPANIITSTQLANHCSKQGFTLDCGFQKVKKVVVCSFRNSHFGKVSGRGLQMLFDHQTSTSVEAY